MVMIAENAARTAEIDGLNSTGTAEAPPSEKEKRERSSDKTPNGSGGGGDDDPPAIDPIIEGLLKRLPKSGDIWPEAERKLWLQLLEGSFKLIYKDAGNTPNIPIRCPASA